MSPVSTTPRIAAGILLVTLLVPVSWAVVKGMPNLSGAWKLDRDRSSGPSLRKAASTLEIRQRGDEVKFVYFSGGARIGSESFLADGSERDRYTTRIERAYSRARWEKDELIITTRHITDAAGYQAYSDTDSWSLSADRKTLTAKLSDGSVLVYEKGASPDPDPAELLKGIVPFHAIGVITGSGSCHGTSFEATVKGEPVGNGTAVFCGPPPQNWGGKIGSCGTHSGTLTFNKDGGGSSFRMTVIGQFCITDAGDTFRGTYEVEKITATGAFMNHIKGGSGEVVFSYASETISINGVLLQE